MTTLSRRHLLRGHWRHAVAERRPPWALEESAFVAGCSRCHACITQCESGVLVVGQGGFPTLDFSRAECTFCRRCADACPQPLFHPRRSASLAVTCRDPGALLGAARY
ncbi:ferredoxin-type protein [Edwardsiella tarda]|nr:ferredoxin-type protein [Edwardsiella tarda]